MMNLFPGFLERRKGALRGFIQRTFKEAFSILTNIKEEMASNSGDFVVNNIIPTIKIYQMKMETVITKLKALVLTRSLNCRLTMFYFLDRRI